MTGAPQLALPIDVTADGELRVYRMVFPFLPPSKNEYDNWLGQWKSAAKKKWIKAVGAECDAQMMPRGVAQIGLAATLVFPRAARRDIQNYANCLWHWVPDALVTAGVISDDTPDKVDFGPNLGITFAYDTRAGAAVHRKRTILSISMVVT
jgi:hypothetical protein